MKNMDHLVHVEQKEIIVDFELGQKCKTTLHIRNLMHTMPVAFKLQTTSPHKFCVQPPNGYIGPLSELILKIILKPQQELPPSFPFGQEKFVLKTALAHITNEDSTFPERVSNEWFSSPKNRVFIDAKLKVVYIGASLLWHCVAREDEYAVKEMLQRCTRPCIAGEDGRTALHIAASIGNFKLVDMLLECEADINAMDMNGRTPLWEAVFGGHVDVVKELLNSGARIDIHEPLERGTVAPIHIAATLTSTEILQLLIESGANLETEDQEGQTAVHFAIEAERLENLKILLHAGADKNAQRGDGRTPLVIAAENGLLEVVHLLLEGGANAHIESENGLAASSDATSERGHVSIIEALKVGEELLRAARQGDVEAVATLLQHRAGKRAWVKDSAGWTALHVAAFKGNVQIVRRLLLEEGGRAAIDKGDAEGHTPLHCGAEGGSVKVVDLLLAMGANPLAATCRGATPADLANALGYVTIAKLLQHHAFMHPANHHYYNIEHNANLVPRIINSNINFHALHQRSISPGPNLAFSYMPSASPNTNHKAVISASSVRFSTPTRLHQNKSKEELLSSLFIHKGRAPEDTSWYSSRTGQHFTSPQHQAPIASKDIKVMQTPVSTKLSDAKDAAECKPLSFPTTSSTAPAMSKTKVPSEEALTHAPNIRSLSHKSGAKSLRQAQNPNAVQSHHNQLTKQKEENNTLATPMQQHTMQKSNSNLQSSRQQSQKLTLAILFQRVHGSKMELSSSSPRKRTQNNLISKLAHSSPNQVKDGHKSSDCNQIQKPRPLFQKSKSISNEVAGLTSDMPLKDKQMIQNGLLKEQSELSLVTHPQKPKPSPPSKISSTIKPLFLDLYTTGRGEELRKSTNTMQLDPSTEHSNANVDALPQKPKPRLPLSSNQEQEEHISESSPPLKPLFLDPYTTESGEGPHKSLHTMQLHPPTVDLNVDGLAFESLVSPVQPQYTHFATPRCEAQPQFVHRDIKDLGLGKQSGMASALPTSQKMAHINAVEDIHNLPSSRSLIESQPQLLLVETSADTICEGLNKPSSRQLQTLTVNPSADVKRTTTDKFVVQLSSTCTSRLDLNMQGIPSASPCCKIAGITTMEDKCVRTLVGQAHLSKTSSKVLEGYPPKETSPSISFPLSDQTSSHLCIQSEPEIRQSHDPTPPSQEVEKNDGMHTVLPHQSVSSARKTGQMLQIVDTISVKPTCKATLSDQNRPIYSPPLTIKQMRKPVSTPILKNSNFLKEMHVETCLQQEV